MANQAWILGCPPPQPGSAENQAWLLHSIFVRVLNFLIEIGDCICESSALQAIWFQGRPHAQAQAQIQALGQPAKSRQLRQPSPAKPAQWFLASKTGGARR